MTDTSHYSALCACSFCRLISWPCSHHHIHFDLYAIILSSSALRTPRLYLFLFIRVFKGGTSVSVITQLNSYCQLTVHSNSTVNTILHIALRWANEWTSSLDPCASYFERVHVCFFWFSVSDWPSLSYCKCSLRNTYCIQSDITLPCLSLQIPVKTELQVNQRCWIWTGTVMRDTGSFLAASCHWETRQT